MNVKPIAPADAGKDAVEVPDAVIEAWNAAINAAFASGGRTASFGRSDLCYWLSHTFALPLGKPVPRAWLNVEHLYRAVGWKVTWDQPAFNEPGELTWTFTRP